MRTPHWSRAALALAACVMFALTAACASSGGSTGDVEGAAPPEGTADRRALGTSRANRLTRADIENSRMTDIAALIESKLTGVSVTRQGNDYVVRIRGATSFTRNTDALVLVDGVESSLGSVSINDIQTIEVLKDAAAAIYGVRGGNGVLLITTKRP